MHPRHIHLLPGLLRRLPRWRRRAVQRGLASAFRAVQGGAGVRHLFRESARGRHGHVVSDWIYCMSSYVSSSKAAVAKGALCCHPHVESEIEYRPPSIIGRVYKICALLEQLLLAPTCSPKAQTLVGTSRKIIALVQATRRWDKATV